MEYSLFSIAYLRTVTINKVVFYKESAMKHSSKSFVNYFVIITLVFCLMFLILFPKDSFKAALGGLVLWFEMIIPALLPFAILSNIFIRFHIATYVSVLFEPILGRLFHIRREGCFCILAGFLFGYPMGAKIANDLVVEGQLSKQEGEFLFLFCNQASPAFILNYVVLNGFQDENLFLPFLGIFLVSSITIGLLLRFIIYRKESWNLKKEVIVYNQKISAPFEVLDSCVMNGVETILKLGAYIILFSIFVKIAEILLNDFYYIKVLCIGILEMTNGVAYLTAMSGSFEAKFLLSLFCVGFGGLSCIFQTASMVKSSHFSMFKYLIAKIMTAFIFILYGMIYLHFFH